MKAQQVHLQVQAQVLARVPQQAQVLLQAPVKVYQRVSVIVLQQVQQHKFRMHRRREQQLMELQLQR